MTRLSVSNEDNEGFITETSYRKMLEEPMRIAIARNQKYGDSVRFLRDEALVDIVMMKLGRLQKMSLSDEKAMDEVCDCLNYLVFLRRRMMKHGTA